MVISLWACGQVEGMAEKATYLMTACKQKERKKGSRNKICFKASFNQAPPLTNLFSWKLINELIY
jgi:hypothetical protein